VVPNGLGRRLPQLAIELPARSGALIEDPLQPVTVTDFDTR
jgi:hypothetical protein